MKDRQLERFLKKEEKRQREGLELIPSENYASRQVRQFLASCFVNKYSEGYPGKRYYGGNQWVDEVEKLAIERAKKLFGVPFVNVQPYSGSPANLAVYLAVCQPGEVVMGQALTAGGHLTHGHQVSATGIYYKSVQYNLKSKILNSKSQTNSKSKIQNLKQDLFDYEQIRQLALKHKPKLIWVGATAYPLKFNYQRFAAIADEVEAYLAADIAHVSGLIAAGVHPSPVPYVHLVTTTTHKTLRGPRGAMIMVTDKGLKKDPQLPDKINKAVFPGLQGGPHDNQTAAIAAALYEALQPSFKKYATQVVKNAQTLAKVLLDGGLTLVGGRTENHLILVDLTSFLGKGAGILAQKALDEVGITLNKNTVPDEPASPFYPSGIRLGTPAVTTRGMKEKEMKAIGEKILAVLTIVKDYCRKNLTGDFYALEKGKKAAFIEKFEKDIKRFPLIKKIKSEVKRLAIEFPIP